MDLSLQFIIIKLTITQLLLNVLRIKKMQKKNVGYLRKLGN